MPDFNKGDFTQQGVNGHVNATVRLNEKRLVNIDMTSNEEAEGCTIVGTVKDMLNDKVYAIGSGGGGGGIDLLHTTISIVNEDDDAYEPNLTLIGYAVKLTELNDTYESVLYCTSLDGPYGVDISTLSVSVPRNSTLTFNAYYLNSSTSEYMGGIMGKDILNATVTNMTYDGGWAIEDKTQNSTLSYVNIKK